MSHGSDEGENYWPGYVDALTSMVQVLAFVMMLLASAIFVLSQNAAKNAIVAIADAEKVSLPKNASVAELTDAIIEKIRSNSASQRSMGEATQPGRAKIDPEKTAQAENRMNPAVDMTAADKGAAAPQTAAPLPQANRLGPETPVDKTTPEPLVADKRISVRFPSRGYELVANESANIAAFVDKRQIVEKNLSLGVRAYAFSGAGRLTEERRVAYYRALVIRASLIERKISASKLRINVLDTADAGQGLTVDIFVIEPGVE
jgi:hypothetical protein